MILQALYQLAQTERLMQDPDCEPKPVAWLVRVSEDGRLLGILGTHQAPKDKDNKRRLRALPKQMSVPRQPIRTSGDLAFFLCDKAEYAFGVEPIADAKKRRSPEQLAYRAAMFRKKVGDCLEATGDDGVRAVHTLLEAVAARQQTIELPEGTANNDLFAFVYAPDIDLPVHERPRVREYWKQSRQPGNTESDKAMTCLVSGLPFSDVTNFPLLKHVPGKGTAKGISLVSFNKRAFESYGWSGNENAPISRDAAETCATALNRLLHPAYELEGRVLAKRNLRLSADTVVCFWSPESGGDEFCSVFGGLLEANPEAVKELYRSVWRGRPVEIDEPAAFYALTLTGTQGRAIVRDWFELTVEGVVRNLASYFADLAIVRNTPKPKDRGHPPQMPLYLLLRSLAPDGDSEKIPDALIGELLETALRGTAFPFAVLQKALERARAEFSRDTWADLERRDARAALIKAFLNRRRRLFPDITGYEEVRPEMEPNNTSEGYTLGRLMAVLERIQQEAIGDANASVVDRYFSGASASPKAVFVRLLKNTRHHVRKTKDEPGRAGFIFLLDRLVDDLAKGFDPNRNGFPAHLNLEQQGLFVLGYHQMRHWLWMSKEDRQRWEEEHPTVPRAYLWQGQS